MPRKWCGFCSPRPRGIREAQVEGFHMPPSYWVVVVIDPLKPGLQSRRSALDDPFRVRVDVEALAAGEADEGDAAGLRQVDGEAGGCRDGDEHGNAGQAGLLNQFEG